MFRIPPTLGNEPRANEPFETSIGHDIETNANRSKITRGARREESEDEDRENTWRDEALEFLNIGKDAGEIIELWRDKSCEDHKENHKCATDFDEFGGVLFAAELGIEVHRGNGRGGVQHGGEGADDGTTERCEHKPGDEGEGLDEVAHQHREGAVVVVFAGGGVQEVAGKEVVGEDSGNYHEEGNEQFKPRRKDDTFLTLCEGFRSKGPLHDVLVEPPVKEVGNPQADQKRGPGNVGILLGANHMKFAAGSIGSVTRLRFAIDPIIEQYEALPCPGLRDLFNGGFGIGDFGKDQFLGRFFCKDTEGKEHNNRTTENERRAPDEVGPGAGFEAPDEDIDRSEGGNEPAHRGEVVENRDGVVVFGDEFRTGENHGGGCDKDEGHDRGDCHGETRDAVETILEEFRNGVEPGLEEFGQEPERHHDQRDCRDPLIGGNRHAQPVGGGARHAHELLGGNVGGDEREAHEPPGQSAAGEEVIARAFFAAQFFVAAFPDSKGNDADNGDDKEANFNDVHVFGVGVSLY